MIRNLPKKDKQSGQVVLITLIVLAIVLSIGMSIISRSITDVKTSQQSQESARAFWVAQGELDKAIRANSSNPVNGTTGDINYTVSRSDLGGADIREIVYPEKVFADTPVTIWLVNHESDGSIGSIFSNPGSLIFYWGESSTNKTAIEIMFVYNDGSYKVEKRVFDPDLVTTGSNFSNPENGGTVDSVDFAFNTGSIDTSGMPNLFFVRVNLIGNVSVEQLGVASDQDLPSQGNCFESTSVVDVSGITRKLTSCQLWRVNPTIFDNAMFSGTSIY